MGIAFTTTILLIALAFAAIPLYPRLLKKNRRGAAAALILGLYLIGAALSGGIYFSTGSFFLNVFLCIPVIFFIFNAGALLWHNSQHKDEYAAQPRPWRMARWLIPLALLAPFLNTSVFDSACKKLNRRDAAAIIAAVEAYRADQGEFPAELSTLIPNYLESIPAGHCTPWSSRSTLQFELMTCNQGETVLLTVPIANGDFIQRYNFASKQWSDASFLDGVCSYLR